MANLLMRVDSLVSLCVGSVVKNLAKYTSSSDVEKLPAALKIRLLHKFTSSNYFWANVDFNRALAMLVDPLTIKVNLTLALVDDEMLGIISKCSNLRSVYMTHYVTDCLTTEKLLQCVASFKKLFILAVPNCNMLNDDVLACVAKNCVLLNSLDVDGCMNVTDKGVFEIAKLANLVSITLSSTQVSNYGVKALVRGRSGSKIRELRINNCAHITSSILKTIAKSCPDLEILTFYNVGRPDCDIQNSYIFEPNNFKNLKQLTWTIQL